MLKKKAHIGLITLVTISIALLAITPARAVDVAISGQINRAILWGDNGNDTDIKFVDNDNSSSRFRFTGSNDFDEYWNVGIVLEVQIESNSSADTEIDIDEDGDVGNVTFTERKIEFFVNHNTYGRVWLGQGDTASNGTSEVDLSGTDVVNYSSIEDMAGGFNFRTDDNDVVTSVGGAFSNFDGFSRRDRIRYDSPKFGPVYFSASYMNGKSWDAAGRFAHQWDGFGKLAAAAHFTPADNKRDPFKQYSGSISFLHDSGFNITASGGGRYDVDGRDEDPYNLYGKLGYKIGKWALSADYTYSEHVAADDDEAQSIGVAAVWNIWDSVQFYGSYRWHDLDRQGVSDIEDLIAVMIGGRVKF